MIPALSRSVGRGASVEPKGPGQPGMAVSRAGKPCSTGRRGNWVGTGWEQGGNREVLPRTVPITPRGKLGQDLAQDLPPAPSLGRKGQVMPPPNRAALESLRSAAGEEL